MARRAGAVARALRGAVVGLAAVALTAAAPAAPGGASGGPAAASLVSGASYAWGYSYRRERWVAAPVGSEAPGPAAGSRAGEPTPFVVPIPGRSQSTPVVVRDRWFQWTYGPGGRTGTLWTGRLEELPCAPAGGRCWASTAASPLTLPGEPGPVLVAPGGACPAAATGQPVGVCLAEPADAAVSPDGRWVAFGVGPWLFWWPWGRPRAGVRVVVPGVAHAAAQGSSSSPTFVPDPAAPSGWAVCTGNWDGGFACYAVGGASLEAASRLSGYLVDQTDPADGGGYTAITSSAAWDARTGRVYFGVASAADPRVVALDPVSGAALAMDGRRCPACPGRVSAPIAAAVAVSPGGRRVYAIDVEGRAYAFDARDGGLLAEGPLPGAGLDVVPPTVTGPDLVEPVQSPAGLLALSRDTLRPLGAIRVAGMDGLSAVTAVSDSSGAGAATVLVFGSASGGAGLRSLPGCWPAGRAPAPPGLAACALPGWPGAPAAGPGFDFSAPVVVGPVVLLWSDGATSRWAASCAADAYACPGQAAPPALRFPGAPGVAGGLQVYALVPRLTAWVGGGPLGTGGWVATVGGPGPRLVALAPPGARVTATLTFWPAVGPPAAGPPPAFAPFARGGTGERPCPSGGAPANLGVFPGLPGSAWPAGGCGALSDRLAEVGGYFLRAAAVADAAGVPRPAAAGLDPYAWAGAGAAYEAWVSVLPSPPRAGMDEVAVAARLPDGQLREADVWFWSACPRAEAPTPGTGACRPLAPPAPACSAAVRQACAGVPGRGDACPPGVGPGLAGMTAAEYGLLCGRRGAVEVDAATLRCYGSWWNWLRRRYAVPGCAG